MNRSLDPRSFLRVVLPFLALFVACVQPNSELPIRDGGPDERNGGVDGASTPMNGGADGGGGSAGTDGPTTNPAPDGPVVTCGDGAACTGKTCVDGASDAVCDLRCTGALLKCGSACQECCVADDCPAQQDKEATCSAGACKYACRSGTIASGDGCVPCGYNGQVCCAQSSCSGGAACSAGHCCSGGQVWMSNQCQAACSADKDKPCGDDCNPGLVDCSGTCVKTPKTGGTCNGNKCMTCKAGVCQANAGATCGAAASCKDQNTYKPQGKCDSSGTCDETPTRCGAAEICTTACVACGQETQVCCPQNGPFGDSGCDGPETFCIANKCTKTGHVGEPCIPGGTCKYKDRSMCVTDAGKDTCIACGDLGQQCCSPNALCQTGYACNGSTCIAAP